METTSGASMNSWDTKNDKLIPIQGDLVRYDRPWGTHRELLGLWLGPADTEFGKMFRVLYDETIVLTFDDIHWFVVSRMEPAF